MNNLIQSLRDRVSGGKEVNKGVKVA
jgi:hypothetical protein